MKWWALYREGQLIGVRQWAGKPTIQDFGVGELYQVEYEITEPIQNGKLLVVDMTLLPLPAGYAGA